MVSIIIKIIMFVRWFDYSNHLTNIILLIIDKITILLSLLGQAHLRDYNSTKEQ